MFWVSLRHLYKPHHVHIEYICFSVTTVRAFYRSRMEDCSHTASIFITALMSPPSQRFTYSGGLTLERTFIPPPPSSNSA